MIDLDPNLESVVFPPKDGLRGWAGGRRAWRGWAGGEGLGGGWRAGLEGLRGWRGWRAGGAGGGLEGWGWGWRGWRAGGAGGLEGLVLEGLEGLVEGRRGRRLEKRAKGAVRNSAKKFQSGQPLISCLERFFIECAHRTVA